MAESYFRSPYAFLGYQCSREKSEAAVLQVPYDGTTSYMAGTRNGPHAIISASRQVEFYDSELDRETGAEISIHTFPELEPDMGSAENTVKRVEELAESVVMERKFPIVFGGEHSISSGVVSAVAKRFKDVSVLQLDAHADLRDSYEGTKFSHASVMRRIREKVKTAVQAGIRSVSAEEMDYIKEKKLESHIYWGSELDEKKIVKQLSDEVYVTIDLDGFDPSECPGVGTPEPGGLRWLQVLSLLKAISRKKRIVGFDIVELMPIAGSVQSEFLAAKLAYKLLGYAFFGKKK